MKYEVCRSSTGFYGLHLKLTISACGKLEDLHMSKYRRNKVIQEAIKILDEFQTTIIKPNPNTGAYF